MIKPVKNFIPIVLAVIIIIACNKNEDDNEEPKNNITELGLVLKIQDNSNSPVVGATVGISYTISETISNTFIESKTTDSEGKTVFTSLTKGDYYYKVTSTFGENIILFTYNGGNQTIIVQVN